MVAPTPPTNKAPTTAGTITLTTDEDSTDAALGITTPTDADGDSLTITVTGLPTGGTLTTADGTEVTNNMTLTISQLTGLIFTPDANLNDSNTDFDSFTYSVSDGSLTSTGTVNISVTPVNDAPEFTAGFDLSIEENHSDVTGLTATDIDDDTLTYSISGGDDQAFFTIDAATGALTFIDRPDFENAQDSDANNIYIVEITIDDGNGGAATQTFNIIVSDVVTGITISNSSIDENSSGAVVGTFTAAIDDLNTTHEYTYTLSGADKDSFDVIDGQLKLKDEVSANYEEKNIY
ncbi:MAG: Ig-like domain-containing protein, partial [Gammaproteobacteria bacterium]|nr:Ig-like domain-containing protein [Gammaproteobacteria bacterium]